MAETCSTCGEEIRFGIRNPTPQWPGARWLHRTEVDHQPTHGRVLTPERWTQILANKDAAVAARKGKKDEPAVEEEEDPWVDEEVPEPEVRTTPVEVTDLPSRSGMRQVANLVLKTKGWELRRLTRARGPYMGARGQVLSISDSLVLGAVGEEVDGKRPFAVASWRDGKFDSAYVGTHGGGRFVSEGVNATDLKNWIKRDLSDPLQQP